MLFENPYSHTNVGALRRNSQGFVAEVDEEFLDAWLKEKGDSYGFGDIDYQDSPDDDIEEILQRAYHIQKPRYVGWLWQAVSSAAYYTKQLAWSYERERRLVISDKYLTKINENLKILKAPKESITALIVGSKASTETKEKIKALAKLIGCPYYQKNIGRSTGTPFLTCDKNKSFIFDDSNIVRKKLSCKKCNEPLFRGKTLCAWSRITEKETKSASERNAFRMLNHAGILDQYLDAFMRIGEK